jgi:replicative DNA helicase
VIDRLPPYDEKLEAGVIGCLMLAPDQCIAEFVGKYRQGEALFYDLRHKNILKLLIEMSEAGHHIDQITLDAAVRKSGRENDVGGLEYFHSLPNEVGSSANLIFYADKVNALYMRRRLTEAAAEITNLAYADNEADEALEVAEQTIMRIRQETEITIDEDMAALMRRTIDFMEESHKNGGKVLGITSGFPSIDCVVRGFRPGQLIIIGARPSQGKTSLGLNIAEHVSVSNQIPVGLFSLEMERVDIVFRMLCSRARIPSKVAEKCLNETEMKAMKLAASQIAKSPLRVCDEGGLSIGQLRAKARRMVQQHKVKLVIVDYLGLLTARAENRTQEVSKVSAGLKAMAKELRIPVIALAQLNREYEKEKGRKPRLSDLRDSGSIEQDADIVAFIHNTPESTSLNIEKHRNGATATIPLHFKKEITRFEECGV